MRGKLSMRKISELLRRKYELGYSYRDQATDSIICRRCQFKRNAVLNNRSHRLVKDMTGRESRFDLILQFFSCGSKNI